MSKIVEISEKAELVKPENLTVTTVCQVIGVSFGMLAGPLGVLAGLAGGSLAAEGVLQARKALRPPKKETKLSPRVAAMTHAGAAKIAEILAEQR